LNDVNQQDHSED